MNPIITCTTRAEILASLARLIGSGRIAASTAINVYPTLVRGKRDGVARSVVRTLDPQKPNGPLASLRVSR